MIPPFLEPALRLALGEPGLGVLSLQGASGGCIHHAARVVTTFGDVFVKWNTDVPEDLFESEARGLEELRRAPTELVIPRVLLSSRPRGDAPGFIVMECLEAGTRDGQFDERLGRGLAAVHRMGSQHFGFEGDTYCGSTRQDNTRADSWPEFYRDRRLVPLLALLLKRRRLSPGDVRPFERLAEKLEDLLPHGVVPSLIHGDLWGGNVMASAGGPALFDPACAYADREMEFGISTLFGGFSQTFFAAYEEAWPLPPGWRTRNPLYQLYHLLNHHLIFGGHYLGEATQVAKRHV